MAYTSRDMRRYNHLLQETDAVYHDMAQHWGLSDSVMGVLYTLCDAGGRCRLRTPDRSARPPPSAAGRS